MRALWKRLQRPVAMSRQRGIALIVVIVVISVLAAVLNDFAYHSTVDLEAAANSRDRMRAEYLARSSINLGRLLIKIQQTLIDKFRAQAGDFQIAEFAPYLIKAFGGDADERAGLGSLLGISSSSMKGLGVGQGASFDLDLTAEDGKLNVNCGGGINDTPRQQVLYGVLTALFFPPTYNSLFDTSDPDGQVSTRDDVAKAIVDWADIDSQKFSVDGKSGGSEDYRYDVGKDPFKEHNHFFDTAEEVNLVRGVGDEFWGTFGEVLTVYGGCKVNASAITPEHWPLMAAIVRATVKDSDAKNPILLSDELMGQHAQMIMGLAKMTGGFSSVAQFIQMATDPAAAMQASDASKGSSGSSSSSSSTTTGIHLDPVKVDKIITVGPRRIWRLDATGKVQRTRSRGVEVHIRAIWDTQHFNQNNNSPDPNDRMGTWLFWRIE